MRQVVTTLIFLFATDAAAAQGNTTSVCDILRRLEWFSGRVVRVRACVQSDVDTWLAAEKCPVVIRAGSVEFENLIALTHSGSPDVKHSRQPRITVPFTTEEASYELLFKALSTRDIKTQKVYAVVEGLIVTRDPPWALVARNDPTNRVGFGHMGMAPAMIVVKHVSNIELVPLPPVRQAPRPE